MRTRFQLLTLILCGVGAAISHAQVQELWRSGLTNNLQRAYTLRDAAVDSAGNTLIAAGKGGIPAGYVNSALVAKFAPVEPLGIAFTLLDDEGNQLWRVQFPNYVKWDSFLTPHFLRIAPDGSWRVIAPLAPVFPNYARGIGVSAFREN